MYPAIAMAEGHDGNLADRGLQCVQSITTDLLTIPNIDSNHLNPPHVVHVSGRRVIRVAPGDVVGGILCGLMNDSGTQCKKHILKCTGCPNPNCLEGDGTCCKTIENVTKHLGQKDPQQEGMTLAPYQRAEVSQQNLHATKNPLSKTKQLSQNCT